MKGRDPMKGRHSVGVQRTSVGKPPGNSAEPASNKVKTQVPSNALIRTQQSKAPVLTDAAHTSADLQKLVRRPPQPFENPNSAVNANVPASPRGAKPGGESVANPRGVYAGKSGATVTARALPSASAVGYQGGKAPTSGNNQVVGGRMGNQQAARKRGDNSPGYPSKRNASFYGE